MDNLTDSEITAMCSVSESCLTDLNCRLKTTDESNKILLCQMQQPLSVKDSSNAEYRHNSICMTV